MRPVIERKHVAAAIRDSDYPLTLRQLLFSPLYLVSASMMFTVVAVVFLLWPKPSGVASQLQSWAYAATTIDADIAELQALRRGEADVALPEPGSEIAHPATSGDTDSQTAGKEAPMVANQVRRESTVTAPHPRELTRARILASIDWLQEADRNGYTVQFAYHETINLDVAESFLAILDRVGLIDDSYVCISTDGGKSSWTVNYGNFSGLTRAQESVDALPAVMQEFQPFVQKMSVVECNTNTTIAALILE